MRLLHQRFQGIIEPVSVESIVAGLKIAAHPDFRVCVTMNDDASTFELPEYIHSRLQPQIFIDFPERDAPPSFDHAKNKAAPLYV